ncbi:MAG: hypothetical protein ACTHXP_07250 [Agrococcus casei]|uniref:hypothetical protein n=1 Tax=Agrococcus casei TaxID=343512 RepID=UPI003F92E30A
MTRRLTALAAAAAVLLTASACSSEPPEVVSPPVAVEVGSTYAEWSEEESPELSDALADYMDDQPESLLIGSENQWQEWLGELSPPLDEQVFPHRPNFSESVIVVGSYFDCLTDAKVIASGDTVLKFVTPTESEADVVECDGAPRVVLLTLVEFEEIGVETADDITLNTD